jgi:hypothetical protein
MSSTEGTFMRSILIAALTLSFCAAHAVAQTTEPKVPGDEQVAPRLDPKACRDGDRLRRGDTVENEGSAPREDPSDKLARTEGVICPPPELDPDIRAPAPAPNSSNMPVIPPPGSPGGDPAVRPK